MFGLSICMFVWYRKDLNLNIIVEVTMENKRTRQHLGEHSRASLAAIAAKRIQNTQSRRKNRAQHRKHQQKLRLQYEIAREAFEHTSSSECHGTLQRVHHPHQKLQPDLVKIRLYLCYKKPTQQGWSFKKW